MGKTEAIFRIVLCLLLSAACLLQKPSHAYASEEANVFVYHRFGDSRFPSTNISLETFRQHLDILRQENCTVITFGELVDLLDLGRPLPPRAAVLTIDDGYKTFLTGAMPLLREYGYRATLFVSTDTVGGRDYLGWEELQRLQGEGIEIGNHSAAHAYLLDRLPGETSSAWRTRIATDLKRAQAAFLEHLGQQPDVFAYPYGEYSPELIEIVKTLGFRAACGQQSGVVSSGDNLYALARFPMGDAFAAPQEFRQKLRMKPLKVEVLQPDSTVVVDHNPPLLRFRLETSRVSIPSLRCFVPGQENPAIAEVSGEGQIFEVKARHPITGRRSKYTLTARDKAGNWYWFSNLWVFPRL